MKNFHVNIGTDSFDLQVADSRPVKTRQFNVVIDNTLFNLNVEYQDCPPIFRLAKMPRWSSMRNELNCCADTHHKYKKH